MSVNAPSIEDIKGAFVHNPLDKIVGQPNFATLNRLSTQTIQNGVTVTSRLGGGNSGLAGLSEAPDIYLLRTGVFFNRPPQPPAQPVYPDAATKAIRVQFNLTWKSAMVEWTTVQRTETLQLSMLERAIESSYLTEIHNESHGFGTRSLQDVLRFLFTTYGQIGPNELLHNQQTLTQAVDPNAPLAIIFKQIEDCQKYATAGGAPLTPQQVLQAAEALIIKTGRYTQAYREWMGLNAANKTYVVFKARFNNEYQLQNAINVTSQNAGYQAHNAYTSIPPDNESEDASLLSAAQDFAAAEAARQSAVDQLASTNGNLNTQLANMAMQNQQMQQQMQQIQYQYANLATNQQAPPRGGRGRGRGRYRGGRSNHQQSQGYNRGGRSNHQQSQGYNNYPPAGPPANYTPQTPSWQRGPPTTPWQPMQQAPPAATNWQPPQPPPPSWQSPPQTPRWQSQQQAGPTPPW